MLPLKEHIKYKSHNINIKLSQKSLELKAAYYKLTDTDFKIIPLKMRPSLMRRWIHEPMIPGAVSSREL